MNKEEYINRSISMYANIHGEITQELIDYFNIVFDGYDQDNNTMYNQEIEVVDVNYENEDRKALKVGKLYILENKGREGLKPHQGFSIEDLENELENLYLLYLLDKDIVVDGYCGFGNTDQVFFELIQRKEDGTYSWC